jgi:hypothetical protein
MLWVTSLHCCGICPPVIQNELNSMPYSTRLIKVDRVGFEPRTSATALMERRRRKRKGVLL